MAASYTKYKNFRIPGPGGLRGEIGTITFDSDATVEVNTALTRLAGAFFTPTGNGGNAATLSVDETITSGEYVANAGPITVDATANSTDTWWYCFLGY